eukprot:scaffold1017_cov374-Prasinococcus_capsulatus_cf.AAC.7
MQDPSLRTLHAGPRLGNLVEDGQLLPSTCRSGYQVVDHSWYHGTSCVAFNTWATALVCTRAQAAQRPVGEPVSTKAWPFSRARPSPRDRILITITLSWRPFCTHWIFRLVDAAVNGGPIELPHVGDTERSYDTALARDRTVSKAEAASSAGMLPDT